MDNYFNTRLAYDHRRHEIWKAIVADLSIYVKPSDVVLDIGAGYCDYINHVNAHEKWALDIFPEINQYAGDGVRVVQASIYDEQKLPSDYFNVAFASNFFEHFTIEELDVIVGIIKKKLKQNGLLILIQPNYHFAYKEYFDDYTHKTAFSSTSLGDFLRCHGFSIKRISPKYLPFSLKSKLSWGYKLVPFYLKSPIKPLAKQMLIVAESCK